MKYAGYPFLRAYNLRTELQMKPNSAYGGLIMARVDETDNS